MSGFPAGYVLLTFPFSDRQSSKVRPLVVLSSDRYNRRSEDFVGVPLPFNLKISYGVFASTLYFGRSSFLLDLPRRAVRQLRTHGFDYLTDLLCLTVE